MPADASIYNALGTKPKSMLDYQTELAQADQNALALKSGQLGYQNALQGQQDAMAMRSAAQQFGTDQTANYNALLRIGNLKAAQDYLKGTQDAAKMAAETKLATSHAGAFDQQASASKLEQSIKAHEFHVQKLASVNTLDDALAWAAEGKAAGIFEQPGQYERGVQNLLQMAQSGPQGLALWKAQARDGGMSATEQKKAELEAANQAEQARQFGVTSTETARHQKASEGLQARGQNITIRGQDMSDARSREATTATLTKPFEVTGPDGLPILVQQDKQGNVTPVAGYGPKPGAVKPLTETQGKATTFAARMQDAEGAIQSLEAEGVSGADLRTIAASSVWTNFLASPKGQQYRQAQENWVTANLRQESGAAIGVNEMAKDVRKFFPIPGDSPGVIKQKTQARAVATQGMLAQAGPGAKQVPGILERGRASAEDHAKVASDADYNALPSGATFIGPDGKTRRKP